MTALLVGLAIVALVAAMLLLSRRGALAASPARPGGDPGGAASAAWLTAARELSASGDLLLADVGWPSAAGSGGRFTEAEGSGSGEPATPRDRLARLSHEAAALTASAPTSMDARVCRSLGVRAKALEIVIDGDDPALEGKLDDFATALRDMKDHVDLL